MSLGDIVQTRLVVDFPKTLQCLDGQLLVFKLVKKVIIEKGGFFLWKA